MKVSGSKLDLVCTLVKVKISQHILINDIKKIRAFVKMLILLLKKIVWQPLSSAQNHFSSNTIIYH